MGLYNFQPQFVPYVEDGSKTHTIRAERKHADTMGKHLYLYTGLRHKGARLLMRTVCVRTDFIRITEDHRVFIGASVGFDSFPAPYGEGQRAGGFVELDEAEKNVLAWRDGFRDDGRDGAFKSMMRFWEGGLPFEGEIIHWKPNLSASRAGGGESCS